MNKKALIIDLDNTIYPVSSIGRELFDPLFKLIAASDEYKGDLEEIKKDIMRRPFQKVANQYHFSAGLLSKGMEMLQEVTCEMDMSPFDDYQFLKDLPIRKFLVTSGFTKMQQSKVRQLNIEQDFEEIHIVDPQLSCNTKMDAFKDIMERHKFLTSDLLVIGDDPNSEIEAAKELGIDHLLYDSVDFNPDIKGFNRISDFSAVKHFI